MRFSVFLLLLLSFVCIPFCWKHKLSFPFFVACFPFIFLSVSSSPSPSHVSWFAVALLKNVCVSLLALFLIFVVFPIGLFFFTMFTFKATILPRLQLSDDVVVVKEGIWPVCAGIIQIDDQSVILVDCGQQPDFLLEELAKRGLSASAVKGNT